MVIKYLVALTFLMLSFSVSAAPVNVNKASIDEISAALAGIGPAKAAAISKYCKKVKCKKPEDLLMVKGIGEKTLKKISKDLRFKGK
ncbi:MAG: helix-hairpin-helix domain-containing protein [Thiomicrorhabdus sp.]|nr:helix-hairpin-helix domain-containing protein [Thiomicrorhabdus sp.]